MYNIDSNHKPLDSSLPKPLDRAAIELYDPFQIGRNSSLQERINSFNNSAPPKIKKASEKKDLGFLVRLPKFVLNWISRISSKPLMHLENQIVNDPAVLAKLPATTLTVINPMSFNHLNNAKDLDDDQLKAFNKPILENLSIEALKTFLPAQAELLLSDKITLLNESQIQTLKMQMNKPPMEDLNTKIEKQLKFLEISQLGIEELEKLLTYEKAVLDELWIDPHYEKELSLVLKNKLSSQFREAFITQEVHPLILSNLPVNIVSQIEKKFSEVLDQEKKDIIQKIYLQHPEAAEFLKISQTKIMSVPITNFEGLPLRQILKIYQKFRWNFTTEQLLSLKILFDQFPESRFLPLIPANENIKNKTELLEQIDKVLLKKQNTSNYNLADFHFLITNNLFRFLERSQIQDLAPTFFETLNSDEIATIQSQVTHLTSKQLDNLKAALTAHFVNSLIEGTDQIPFAQFQIEIRQLSLPDLLKLWDKFSSHKFDFEQFIEYLKALKSFPNAQFTVFSRDKNFIIQDLCEHHLKKQFYKNFDIKKFIALIDNDLFKLLEVHQVQALNPEFFKELHPTDMAVIRPQIGNLSYAQLNNLGKMNLDQLFLIKSDINAITMVPKPDSIEAFIQDKSASLPETLPETIRMWGKE